MMNYNNIFIGMAVGAALPFVGYACFLMLNDTLIAQKIATAQGNTFDGFSLRFLMAIAICLNIFPMRYFSTMRWDEALRGMTFPVIGWVGVWMYFHGLALIGY
jgi:hypothetical protein